jgi:hypothetical protein
MSAAGQSGSVGASRPCPLYPQKQTSGPFSVTSALGAKSRRWRIRVSGRNRLKGLSLAETKSDILKIGLSLVLG